VNEIKQKCIKNKNRIFWDFCATRILMLPALSPYYWNIHQRANPVKEALFVPRFIMSCWSLRRSGMTRVNEGSHSFTCHPHVYPQVHWAIPAFTPQLQSITALWPVLISCPTEGRRLSWPKWLGEILRWFARPKTVTHPSTSRGGREPTSQVQRANH